jgi:hypothetical protein
MKCFKLVRHEDESGVSGTGVVAQGVIFDDGQAAMRWLTKDCSTGIYDSIEALERIHGHGGKTRVVYCDPDAKEFARRLHQSFYDKGVEG